MLTYWDWLSEFKLSLATHSRFMHLWLILDGLIEMRVSCQSISRNLILLLKIPKNLPQQVGVLENLFLGRHSRSKLSQLATCFLSVRQRNILYVRWYWNDTITNPVFIKGLSFMNWHFLPFNSTTTVSLNQIFFVLVATDIRTDYSDFFTFLCQMWGTQCCDEILSPKERNPALPS